jgi:hypothetical protein
MIKRKETVFSDNEDTFLGRCAHDTISQFGMNSNALSTDICEGVENENKSPIPYLLLESKV